MSKDVRPPNPPWKRLEKQSDDAYVTFYYSDPTSPLPAREVTRPQDNKSDPNLETSTFGLFSTCEERMRASLVKNGIEHIIFLTNRGARVVAGYYRVGWYCEGVFGLAEGDYALAAEEVHFIDPPIALSDLPASARSEIERHRRGFLRLEEGAARDVIRTVKRRKNKVNEYLEEIDRLERFNQRVIGFRCWRRDVPFSWDEARALQGKKADQEAAAAPNTSPTGLWLCGSCKKEIRYKSRLKQCPFCGAVGSLTPIKEPRPANV